MPHLEPTYLRYIYDGLIKGSIHPENAAELPEGLIGLYEEAFDERQPVHIRQQLLERFAIWALLKKEVSAQFVAEVLNQPEEDIQEFIATYSAWFNSPESGKYQLYHERLKVYFLQKLSEGEIKYLNSLIIDKIYCQTGHEFEMYKIEYLVFHLFINEEFFQAYHFLIDYQTFLDAEKHFQSDIILQRQFDLYIRKFAQLEKESEVLELIRIQFRQLDFSLTKVIDNPMIILDTNRLIETIEASKKLILRQKISFWQEVLVKLIQNTDYLHEVNKVLRTFDDNIENFSIIERNNSHKFIFDGISRSNLFLLLNYLLDNNFEVKWLIDRSNWLPNYSLSRDAILDDEEYFSDFKMIKVSNQQKIIEHFKDSLKRKSYGDLYRSENWCLKFISRLADINLVNQNRKISFDEISISKVSHQRKEKVIYSYSQKYMLSSLPYGINDKNWKNLLIEDLDDYKCLKILIEDLDNELIFDNENLKCLFIDCLYEICFITEGEFADYTIEDALLEEMILMFLKIYVHIGIDKFIKAIIFFSANFQISIWNEYIGETGPLNLNETILETFVPFLIKYDNNVYNINSMLNCQLIKKCEIILCFCDILGEKAINIFNIPKFNLKELTTYFHKEPEYLFYISACLNIDLSLVYQNITSANNLNLKSALLFVHNSFLTKQILEIIEENTRFKIDTEDRDFTEVLLPKVIINLVNSEYESKVLISQLLNLVINSKKYYDITDLINSCSNKSFFFMKFRNDFKYANQFVSQYE
jgi:hypothetical protein